MCNSSWGWVFLGGLECSGVLQNGPFSSPGWKYMEGFPPIFLVRTCLSWRRLDTEVWSPVTGPSGILTLALICSNLQVIPCKASSWALTPKGGFCLGCLSGKFLLSIFTCPVWPDVFNFEGVLSPVTLLLWRLWEGLDDVPFAQLFAGI